MNVDILFKLFIQNMTTLTKGDGMEILTTVADFSDKARKYGLPPTAHIRITVDDEELNKTTLPVKSKWGQLVQEIKDDPDLQDPAFQEAWRKTRKNMQEMRNNLIFTHDK
jgi:hypothetical protein